MVEAAVLRGPLPVGVRTLHTEVQGRRLHLELWYPAASELRGCDLDRAHQDRYEVMVGMPGSWQSALRDAPPAETEDRWPLVVFSHGFGGHRRQSSTVCAHLASHGFAVIGVDHAGNTLADLARPMMRAMRGQEVDLFVQLEEVIVERPRDVARAADQASAFPVGDRIDAARYALVGHSFGGWTALQAAGQDPRVASVTALAPVGGPHPRGDGFERALDLTWERPVPTTFVVAERDSMVPVDGTRALFARVPSPKAALTLHHADHLHFCDRPRELHEMYRSTPAAARAMGATRPLPPFAELCPADHSLWTAGGAALTMARVLLHRDDRWKDELAGVERALRERGVAVTATMPSAAPKA